MGTLNKKEEVIILLRHVKIFASFSDEELSYVAERLKLKYFKKNEVFLYQEDHNMFMYIVISGYVKISIINNNGRAITLAIRQAGEYFGELSLIDNKATSASVCAMEDSSIALLSKKDFHLLLGSQPMFQDNIIKVLCSMIRETNDLVMRLTYNKAPQKISLFFIEYLKKYGEKTESGIMLPIRLTHQDIADMTGLLRETVTRILDKWKDKGYITLLDGRFYHINQRFFKKDFEM